MVPILVEVCDPDSGSIQGVLMKKGHGSSMLGERDSMRRYSAMSRRSSTSSTGSRTSRDRASSRKSSNPPALKEAEEGFEAAEQKEEPAPAEIDEAAGIAKLILASAEEKAQDEPQGRKDSTNNGTRREPRS